MTEVEIKQDKCSACNGETDHEVNKDECGEHYTCTICGHQHGYLSFGIGENFGNMFTEMVRQIAWWECKRERAILMLLKSMGQMDVGQAEAIIDGKFKLVTATRGSCQMVQDFEWEPPYAEIEKAKENIQNAFAYIGYPSPKKRPLGGCWYDHLSSSDSKALRDEAYLISQLEETNIWKAGSRAVMLREWSEEIMRRNAKERGEKFRATKSARTPKERAMMLKESSGLLKEMKAMALSNIAQSDMPEDMKRRMMRVADGQIEAMQGEVQIVPDETFVFDTGWLAPDGIYYGCKPGQHIDLSHKLAKEKLGEGDVVSAEYMLEQEGWAKCSAQRWHYACDDPLNPAQIKTLKAWTKKWGDPIEWNGRKGVFVKEVARFRGDVPW